jgi:arsenate reductase
MPAILPSASRFSDFRSYGRDIGASELTATDISSAATAVISRPPLAAKMARGAGWGWLSKADALSFVNYVRPRERGKVARRQRVRSRESGGVITIYGIKNCDTMKKARAWLDGSGAVYAFHDYKAAGIERSRLEGWARQVGWERLLNRAGTTFRKLPDKEREALDERRAIALMLAQPSMIKRPVLELGGRLLVGFKPDEYATAVKKG